MLYRTMAENAIHLHEFQRRPVYRHRPTGYPPTPEVAAKIELLAEYLREHGPSLIYDAFKAIGGPLKGSLRGGILNAMGDIYPVWQDNGFIGILGHGDDKVC